MRTTRPTGAEQSRIRSRPIACKDLISYELQEYVELNLHASRYTRKENTQAGLYLNTKATMFQLVFRDELRWLIVHADKQICSGGLYLILSMLVYLSYYERDDHPILFTNKTGRRPSIQLSCRMELTH